MWFLALLYLSSTPPELVLTPVVISSTALVYFASPVPVPILCSSTDLHLRPRFRFRPVPVPVPVPAPFLLPSPFTSCVSSFPLRFRPHYLSRPRSRPQLRFRLRSRPRLRSHPRTRSLLPALQTPLHRRYDALERSPVFVCMCVCVCVCIFIKLHITAQSGPVILVILCHSH